MNIKERKYFQLLLLLSILLLFTFLGLTLFNTRGEPREAIVSYTMLESGNWILPINNGGEMAFKPPFFHWLVASFSWLFGGVSEYTSRMPSAVALAIMLFFGYFFYSRRSGSRLAFVASLITLTNFEVHRAGTNCRVDMLLTACIVCALYFINIAIARRKTTYWLGAILCMSGAMLTKGPVGIILPCLVGFAYEWLTEKRFWHLALRYVTLAAASLVLPLLWYVAAYEQGGKQFLNLVYEENVLRFLGKMSYRSHENPAIYNVLTVVSGFLPYTLLVLLSLFTLNYSPLKVLGTKVWWKESLNRLRQMDRVRLFSLLSFALIFIFYCIPKSKRSVYLLPIYPFLSYFLAEYIFYLWRTRKRVVMAFGKTMAVLALLVSGFMLSLRFLNVSNLINSFHLSAEMQSSFLLLSQTPLGFWGVVAIAFPAAAAVLYFVFASRCRKTRGFPFYGIFILPYSLFFALDCYYQPTLMNPRSDFYVAQQVKKQVPGGNTIYSFMPTERIADGNKMHFFTVNFYLHNQLIQQETSLPTSGYAIVGEEDYKQFFVKKFGSKYTTVKVRDFHHKSCDTRQNMWLVHFEKNK